MTYETDVVIATRNRPAALRRCLGGLSDQSYRDFSVIIVDDASDEAIDVAALLEVADGVPVRVVRLPEQSGPARARNAGVAESSAQFIVFIDDDVRPDWRLLEQHITAIRGESNRMTVSCGPFVEPADWDPTPWNLWEARQAKTEADALLRGDYAPTWRQFHTGNNALRRELFQRVGGFDEAFLRAEDDEFALRLELQGAHFVFTPEAIAWHYSQRTLAAWLHIPAAYAHFDARMDEMYPEVGHLGDKLWELDRRHPLLRLARRVFASNAMHPIGVWTATTAARGLHRMGAVEPAMHALSLAYDLQYSAGIRRELRAREQALARSARPGRALKHADNG